MNLIDRDALKKAIGSYVVDDAKLSFNQLYENEDLLKVFDIVNAMPTVDAEPVRHGKWIGKSTGGEYFDCCSECGYVEWDAPNNYCPRCGAKMDADEEKRKMKPSFDNLKGRRVYQFVLDEKTGKIEDISHSMDYVKVVRCKDCVHHSAIGPCAYWYGNPCVDDNDYCSKAKRDAEQWI